MNTNFKSKRVETQKLHMTKHCKVVEDDEHVLLSCREILLKHIVKVNHDFKYYSNREKLTSRSNFYQGQRTSFFIKQYVGGQLFIETVLYFCKTKKEKKILLECFVTNLHNLYDNKGHFLNILSLET